MKKLIMLFAFLIVIYNSIYYSNMEMITVTINDKERITESHGNNVESKYLIYTSNGVYENTDDILLGKFDSSDIYNQLKEGKTYNIRVVGFRIPLFSKYKNIVEVVE